MHYSNWLIGVKNRASLRNACKTPPNIDWNNMGKVVDVRNNNPLPDENSSERMTVATHIWKKGKRVNYTAAKTMPPQIYGPETNNSAWLAWLAFFLTWQGMFYCFYFKIFSRCAHKESNIEPEFLVPSSGQSGGRRRAPLPRRRSANRASVLAELS